MGGKSSRIRQPSEPRLWIRRLGWLAIGAALCILLLRLAGVGNSDSLVSGLKLRQEQLPPKLADGSAPENSDPASALALARSSVSAESELQATEILREWRILILDDRNRPVVGCQTWIVHESPATEEALPLTNEKGLTRSTDLRFPLIVSVGGGDWAHYLSVVPEYPAGGVHELHLTPPGRIAGQVKTYAEAPLAGAVVLAFAREEPITVRSVLHRLRTESHGGRALTTPEGRFEFTSLDPRSRYRLVAGAIGWLGGFDLREEESICGDLDRSITAYPIYGVLVKQEFRGLPLVQPSAFPHSLGMEFHMPEQTPRIVSQEFFALAGLPTWLRDWEFPYRCTMFAFQREHMDAGKVRMNVAMPGYSLRRVDVPLQRAGPDMSATVVDLQSENLGRGRVRLTLVGRSNLPEVKGLRDQTRLEVWLTKNDDEAVISFWSSINESKLLDNVPAGEYSVGVLARSSAFTWPRNARQSGRILVEDGQTTQVDVDAASTGDLSIEAWVGSKPYTGPMEFKIAGAIEWNPNYEKNEKFLSAPYQIPLLPRGTYSVTSVSPRTGQNLSDPIFVKIDSDALVRCRVELADINR